MTTPSSTHGGRARAYLRFGANPGEDGMNEIAGGSGAAVEEVPVPHQTPREPTPYRYPDRAARHWILASVVWLTVVDLFGLVLATQFVTPEAFGNVSWLAFSRIRPSHV